MMMSRRKFSALGVVLALVISDAGAGGASDQPLYDYGPAPEFAGIDHWINSEPLAVAGLAGKIVLVDFWTYSCVNCLRTLPQIIGWYDKYKDEGLIVVGVHTPEFAYERDLQNLRAAVERFGIKYPIAQDNHYATWKAYDNEYWPALYLIDQHGRIVLKHFGEGEYGDIHKAIRALLANQAASNRGSR